MTAPLRKRESHIWAREADEHYVEPAWCSMRLFEEEEFAGQIWDPCCGFGTIVLNASARGHATYASDIIERRAGVCDDFQNFLDCNDHCASPNIVCNPPFNIAPHFALRALALKATQKVAMIFPVARLNAAHWIRDTPLRRVWLLSPRPSMPPGHVIAAGGKPGGGKTDFAWIVWEKGFAGAPELKWLTRIEQAKNRRPRDNAGKFDARAA